MTRHDPLTAAELALAYELHQEGCCWKRIALGLGVCVKTLHSAITDAERDGITHRIARDARRTT